MSLGGLNAGELTSVKNTLNMSPEEVVNDENVELQWAMKAFHHAETYFNLISAVEPGLLKLTRFDDDIHALFRTHFSDLDVALLTDDILKNKDAKVEWRTFCEMFKGQIEDYNMGSLLRLDCTKDISDANTTLVPRIQFLAIEITRNREGLNNSIREKFGKQTTNNSKQSDADIKNS